MLTANYIKVLRIIEDHTERSKIIRLWALNLSNELSKTIIASPNPALISGFLIKMAEKNILDEVFLITALNFIDINNQNPNFAFAISIICHNGTLESISLAEKVLKISSTKAKLIALCNNTTLKNKDKIISFVFQTDNLAQINAINEIVDTKITIKEEFLIFYINKIMEATTDEEIVQVLNRYRSHMKSIIKFNSNIYSMSTEEMIRFLEITPYVQGQELTKEILELTFLRDNKCQDYRNK